MCNETGDRAACFHLARQYENAGQVKEAISFFARAQAYGQGIRLCKVLASNSSFAWRFSLARSRSETPDVRSSGFLSRR